jgi:hypothetical protein
MYVVLDLEQYRVSVRTATLLLFVGIVEGCFNTVLNPWGFIKVKLLLDHPIYCCFSRSVLLMKLVVDLSKLGIQRRYKSSQLNCFHYENHPSVSVMDSL